MILLQVPFNKFYRSDLHFEHLANRYNFCDECFILA